MLEIIGVILFMLTVLALPVFDGYLIGAELLETKRSFSRNVWFLLLGAVLLVLCSPLALLVLCIRRWGWLSGLLRAVGVAVLWVLLLVGSGLMIILAPVEITETDNLADYRIVTGNYNNERPQAFIDSFFPAEIRADFADPIWHYKARKFDSIACEAYLEFCIPEEAAFAAHYAGLAQHGEPQAFPFDARYEMWVIDNRMDAWTSSERGEPDGENPDVRNIEAASVGLILCDREAQRFVYFALMVHDGGATDETDLNYFFDRFGVALWRFENAICQ